MKWVPHLAIAALISASFTVLVARQHEPMLAAGLRDFNNYYARFQGKVDGRIEPVFKRDLIANAWSKLNEQGKKVIREAVRNRKAFRRLDDGWEALAGLGFHDQQTGSTISGMRAPDFTKENSTGIARVSHEPARPPAGLEKVSLDTVRLATIVEFPSKKNPVPESEEVQEMDSAVRTGLSDMIGDSVTHQRLYRWLDIHFPGLDDLLNSIKDADQESIMNLKEARDRAMRRNLELQRSALDDLVVDEARAGAARVPLRAPQVFERSRNISRERDTIHRVEVLLRQRAPRVIQSALQSSKARTQHMVAQMHKLNELYPFLNLFSRDASEYKRVASQITQSQETRPHNLEKIKPFADVSSIDQLSEQLSTEQYGENLLAALVGWGDSQLPEIKTTLGPEADKYQKIYDEWWQRKVSSLVYGDD